LLKVTQETMAQATQVLEQLRDVKLGDVSQMTTAMAIRARESRTFSSLHRALVSQTERRVLRGKRSRATDKIVSIFEPHTGHHRQGPTRIRSNGHKVCLTSGASGMVLDLVVQRGNPPTRRSHSRWWRGSGLCSARRPSR